MQDLCKTLTELSPDPHSGPLLVAKLPQPLTWRIEAQCCSRGAICDQVNPKQLHRYESLRKTQRSCEEDGCHFTHIAADHVADEGLHVVVDGPAFLYSSNLQHKMLL